MQASITNSTTRYGWVAILLHWLIGIIFIGQFALGFVMVRLTSQRTAFELIQLHKSFGFLLLGLIILRIAWRLGNAAPALPASVGALGARTAPLAHLALYAFQLALPLSGWALVSVSMLEIPSLPFNLFVMPNLPLGRIGCGGKLLGSRALVPRLCRHRTGRAACRWRRCAIISGCATACSRA